MSDGLSLNLDTKRSLKSINELLTVVERPEKLLKQVQRYVKSITNQMFTGKRPDTAGGKRGISWKKLEPSTIESKIALAKKGKLFGTGAPRRPMISSGALRDSHKVLIENNKGFTYGSRVKSKEGFGGKRFDANGPNDTGFFIR
jgi:hypothetical protein